MRYVRYIDPFYYSAASLRLFSRHGGDQPILKLDIYRSRLIVRWITFSPSTQEFDDRLIERATARVIWYPGQTDVGCCLMFFDSVVIARSFHQFSWGGSVCCAICRRRPKKKKHNFAILVKWQGLSCVIIVNRYERYSKQKRRKKKLQKKVLIVRQTGAGYNCWAPPVSLSQTRFNDFTAPDRLLVAPLWNVTATNGRNRILSFFLFIVVYSSVSHSIW